MLYRNSSVPKAFFTRWLAVALMLVTLLCVCSGCGSISTEELLGTWSATRINDGKQLIQSYVFKDDGTCEYIQDYKNTRLDITDISTITYSYKTEDNVLIFTRSESTTTDIVKEETKYKCKIRKDELTLEYISIDTYINGKLIESLTELDGRENIVLTKKS